MQTKLSEFRKMGIEVLGISSSTQEELKEKMLPKGIRFPLLSDPSLEVIDAYGLRHEGGNPFGGDVSRPAVFLIDENGAIVERILTENWRVRPTPEVILERFGESSLTHRP